MTWLLLIVVIIGLGYASYRVWFRSAGWVRMLQNQYPESARTPRAFAGSRFTLWGFRIITTTLFLVVLFMLLAAVFSWAQTQ